MSASVDELWDTALYFAERAKYYSENGNVGAVNYYMQRLAGALVYLDLRMSAAVDRYAETGVMIGEGQ